MPKMVFTDMFKTQLYKTYIQVIAYKKALPLILFIGTVFLQVQAHADFFSPEGLANTDAMEFASFTIPVTSNTLLCSLSRNLGSKSYFRKLSRKKKEQPHASIKGLIGPSIKKTTCLIFGKNTFSYLITLFLKFPFSESPSCFP
ncbi:MAG: hypothetical protein A2Z72_03145 [Omnitrophica bacterium RBG_13_46_9]|nr:MAG: hypothetical protein A2Z72_03145 [Omnitrophica bacterium RBG_13_46_9]